MILSRRPIQIYKQLCNTNIRITGRQVTKKQGTERIRFRSIVTSSCHPSLSRVRSMIKPGQVMKVDLSRSFLRHDRCKFSTIFNDKYSPRQVAEFESQLLEACRSVYDPVLSRSLKELGWIRRVSFFSNQTDDNKDIKIQLKVDVKVPSLLYPSLNELESMIRKVVMKMSEDNLNIRIDDCLIDMKAGKIVPDKGKLSLSLNQAKVENSQNSLGPGLANVSQFLAVYSCKGGVGKSTIAANLAYALVNAGVRVGLLDVDVYGPSLPILIQPDDSTVRRSPLGKSMVMPIQHRGLKMLSLGFVSPDSGVPGSGFSGSAAVMRGPMAGRVVSQLLKGTDWGHLDLLILDLPPGTGDVQLQLCQDIEINGAVTVTTPSNVAITDTMKGIDMFTSLGVPTIAVVENMSYFECEGGGKHYPFGRGDKDMLSSIKSRFGIDESTIFKFPVSTYISESNDEGIPIALSRPNNATNEVGMYDKLAQSIRRSLFTSMYDENNRDSIIVRTPEESFKIDIDSMMMNISSTSEEIVIRLYSENSATQLKVNGHMLRKRDPKTGEVCSNSQINSKIAQISKKGKYGYVIEWDDGSKIIYSLLSISMAIEEALNRA